MKTLAGLSLVVLLVTSAAISSALAAGMAAAAGYRGQISIDYRYTSGGKIAPGSPAEVGQTARLMLTVSNGRIVHLHGVVGLDYKWINTGCPNFTVETIARGAVDTKPTGDGIAFIDDWNWSPGRHGRYVMPAPAVPNTALVTVTKMSPDNDCNTIRQTDRETFSIAYLPKLTGSLQTPRRIVGSLIRTYRGPNACHAFGPTPPPPPVGVSCSWKLHWILTR